MQKEYKEAMERISLSDSDKKRILANVKEAYEESEDHVVSMDDFEHKRPRFSARRIGTVAAAAVVLLLAGTWMLRNQLFLGEERKDPRDPVIVAETDEEVWEELDSVDAIAKETDCRTYILSNVSKGYKVKKVEVEKKQKHVKITYKEEKRNDRILLEYKEEENAPAVIDQFETEKELTKETVGDSEVTMYGDGKCDGMTWQQEDCTFAVKMTKACSTEKAKTFVSGTKEKKEKPSSDKGEKTEKSKKISGSAQGWNGNEKKSGDRERNRILKKIYELYGFRVTIEDPAKGVAYKIVEDFESFSFVYDEFKELKNQKIVGYAGQKGCPPGMLGGYESGETYSVNGSQVRSFQNDNEEWLFYFEKQEIHFTFLIKEWNGENTEQMLSGLLSTIHISLDEGHDDSEGGNDSLDDPDPDTNAKDKDDEKEPDETVSSYRETVQDIQYAVAEGSLKKLSSYMKFPLSIRRLGISVSSAKEFQALEPSQIFTSAWVDAVVDYDSNKIKSSTKSFVMGNERNAIVCKIQNDSVVITELRVDVSEVTPTAEPTDTPSEE